MHRFERVKGRHGALSFEKCNYGDGVCGTKEKIYKESEISTRPNNRKREREKRESERIYCLAMG